MDNSMTGYGTVYRDAVDQEVVMLIAMRDPGDVTCLVLSKSHVVTDTADVGETTSRNLLPTNRISRWEVVE